MATRKSFGQYVKAAFNAKPLGMFVAPNWIGIGACGLLGVVNPGFWVLGAGLELAYLVLLSTNRRFQRIIDGRAVASGERSWVQKVESSVARLGRTERAQYEALASRCRSIVEQQESHAGAAPGLELIGQSLGRLSWTYLRLLSMRQAIESALGADSDSKKERASLEGRLRTTRERLADQGLGDDLRRSLSGQVEILEQRLEKRSEAREKLGFVEAELTRIEEQVELIREQAALSNDPASLSHRIDEVASTLGSTAAWVKDQQRIYGVMEDLLEEPPPITPSSNSEAQRQ